MVTMFVIEVVLFVLWRLGLSVAPIAMGLVAIVAFIYLAAGIRSR